MQSLTLKHLFHDLGVGCIVRVAGRPGMPFVVIEWQSKLGCYTLEQARELIGLSKKTNLPVQDLTLLVSNPAYHIELQRSKLIPSSEFSFEFFLINKDG